MKKDIILISAPYLEPFSPTAAPAFLKGHLQSNGLTASTRDLNIEIRQKVLNENPEYFPKLVAYWTDNGYLKTGRGIDDSLNQYYTALINTYAKELSNENVKWLGISVFTYHSVNFALDFLNAFKKYNTKGIKVVIGGAGVDYRNLEQFKSLYDAYIFGEGEEALVELLSGNMSFTGVNGRANQIENIDSMGIPDYDDYDLDPALYDSWTGRTLLQVTGSRGCVRKCTFCNVQSLWKKYKWRPGVRIAEEIIHQYKKHKVTDIYFTDSLINGNTAELLEMCRTLIKFKETDPEADFTWGGQWISRPASTIPKDYYKLIKASGGQNISMGVETGSDKVLGDMDKKFSIFDLDLEMENFKKHRIYNISFFMFIGFPTETIDDFYATLRLIKRYQKYVASLTLGGMLFGSGYRPDEDSPISNMGLYHWGEGDEGTSRWYSTNGETNYLENIRRTIIAFKVMYYYKMPYPNVLSSLRPIWQYLQSLEDEHDLSVELSELNTDIPEEFTVTPCPEILEINCLLAGSAGISGNPKVEISLNDTVIDTVEVNGEQYFSFKSDNIQENNTLKIKLINKKDNDDIIDSDGNFVSSTSVSVKAIEVDGVMLTDGKLEEHSTVNDSLNSDTQTDLFVPNAEYQLKFGKYVARYFIENGTSLWSQEHEISEWIEQIDDMFHKYVINRA